MTDTYDDYEGAEVIGLGWVDKDRWTETETWAGLKPGDLFDFGDTVGLILEHQGDRVRCLVFWDMDALLRAWPRIAHRFPQEVPGPIAS